MEFDIDVDTQAKDPLSEIMDKFKATLLKEPFSNYKESKFYFIDKEVGKK